LLCSPFAVSVWLWEKKGDDFDLFDTQITFKSLHPITNDKNEFRDVRVPFMHLVIVYGFRGSLVELRLLYF